VAAHSLQVLKERLAAAQLGYFPRFKIAQYRILPLAVEFFEGRAESRFGVFTQGSQSTRVPGEQLRIGSRERAIYVENRSRFDGAGRISGRQNSRGNRIDQLRLAHAESLQTLTAILAKGL
jgi:hypothetical protein